MPIKVRSLVLERQAGNLNMINYPIGDFLIQIKNAANADKKEFEVDSTNLIKDTAQTLKSAGYLEEVSEKGGVLSIRLAYKKKEPVLMNIKLVSKPGLRIYMNVDDIEKIKGPFTLLISTPKGVVTSKRAIKERIGGEVIAKIW